MTDHAREGHHAMSFRIEAIARKHRQIDQEITQESRRPLPDAAVLQRLKRQKLQLKDEMARHEGLLRTLSRATPHPGTGLIAAQ